MPWCTLANLLTGLRGLLAPILVWAVLQQLQWLAFWVFWLAVVTDLLDGRVARRRNEVTRFGGILDHSTDALFVAAGLTALAVQGVVTILLPPLVLVAFLQYSLDSRVLAGKALRSSFLGRNNGIAYYVLLGTPIVGEALSLGWPSASGLRSFAWLLVASTLISMVDRAVALWFSRRVPDSLDEGK